jgi:hypothetical protein
MCNCKLARRRTRFSFSDDDVTSVEDVFELFEIKITIRGTRGSSCWYDCFLDSQLNGKSLKNTAI